jgi:hypothetical protein
MRISNDNENNVRKSLEQMIRQFHKISVIELKEMKSISAVRKSGKRT